MAWIDPLFSIKPLRKAIWRLWYPYLTRQLAKEESHRTVFLNYAYETEPPWNLPLDPADESDRGCIQLYHHTATLGGRSLSGLDVLEASCGHGGGASYLTRTFHPRSYTGLDLNPEAVRFCQRHHSLPELRFLTGDAENLPFPDNSFDAVVNVEASHCYPDFPRFLTGVSRVLRPGGYFHYADFRFDVAIPEWEQALQAAPLRVLESRVIDAEVLRGMDLNSARSEALMQRHLPRFLHGLGRDFAGIRGSRIYQALKDGTLSYRSMLLRKS
ncbi:MAG: class I SAM-dependent methyltransferase [Candidatus Methylacidiphilales bacterium]|nr:class I SAM-dependent methyltransferase [Candidatus Methylacidiphilales bacterium]